MPVDLDSDALDGVLFRLWIRLASTQPSRVARALLHCLTPADYRAVLLRLAQEDRVNLPPAGRAALAAEGE